MVTPKSVVETTPLVVARIEQRERAQRAAASSAARKGDAHTAVRAALEREAHTADVLRGRIEVV